MFTPLHTYKVTLKCHNHRPQVLTVVAESINDAINLAKSTFASHYPAIKAVIQL